MNARVSRTGHWVVCGNPQCPERLAMLLHSHDRRDPEKRVLLTVAFPSGWQPDERGIWCLTARNVRLLAERKRAGAGCP